MIKHGRQCFYCRRIMTIEPNAALTCTIDHLVPRADGGRGCMSNYVAACNQCNNARGTVPSGLFARYVRRFGPPTTAHMKTTNRYMRRAASKMESQGMSQAAINDVIRIKLQEAWARLQIAG